MTHTNKGVGGLKETIAIVDYGAGNLQSVKKALDFIGAPSVITKDAEAIRSADAVILPGVGSFADAMDSMRASGLTDTVIEAAQSGKPFWAFVWGFSFCLRLLKSPPEWQGLAYYRAKFYAFHKRMG